MQIHKARTLFGGVLATAAITLGTLVGPGTASADGGCGEPKYVVGRSPESSQSIEQMSEQTNKSAVWTDQTNKNVNVSPAVALFGKAYTSQANDNVAVTKVEQENESEQTQFAKQEQEPDDSGHSYSRPGKGSYGNSGAEQSIEQESEQTNKSAVWTDQTNKNVNVSPAVALFGKAYTSQANDNVAVTKVEQENESHQTQFAKQEQESDDSGHSYSRPGKGSYGNSGAEQSIEQESEQTNKSAVWTDQTNKNVNVSPAVALFGKAYTSQDNDNVAVTKVEQENESHQTQFAKQEQESDDSGHSYSQPGKGSYGSSGAEQSIGQESEQTNRSAVSTDQANWNVNVSPAVALFGDASTSQDNDNVAVTKVEQENESKQFQLANQILN